MWTAQGADRLATRHHPTQECNTSQAGKLGRALRALPACIARLLRNLVHVLAIDIDSQTLILDAYELSEHAPNGVVADPSCCCRFA